MAHKSMIPIQDGWYGLWHRIGAKGDAWGIYLDLVFKRYFEPHRYYHIFPHILQMLKEFKEVRGLCENPDAMEMALYFHDAIYKVGKRDNEEQSAALARSILEHARVDSEVVEEVGRLILVTKKHDTTAKDNDGKLLIDMDISIFGQMPDVFDLYEINIWKEYVLVGGVPENTFAEKRAEVFKRFLESKQVYLTPYFRKKYGVPARKNLERSLRQLKAA